MRNLLLAIMLTLPGFANAVNPIGSVTDTKGTSCQVERSKKTLPGDKGSAIEPMDIYLTKTCVSTLTFVDETKVKVTENSRLLIDDFVYDPKKSDAGKLALKVGMGTVRYASGQIAKNNPQQVAVKTPTASIAVRGTDFSMTVDETGQSLVVLLPSCKDDSEMKKYELEENKCRVGEIDVETPSGKVTLNQAFHATYVALPTLIPTPPVVLNTVESQVNSNLIIVKPMEIQMVVKEHAKTKYDKEVEELEAEAQRRLAMKVKETEEQLENARLLLLRQAAEQLGCNPSTNICISWENPNEASLSSRGKGIAFRSNIDHYAEVKTQGYNSNTFVTITHNDAPASEIIGSGDPGGTVVNIKQNVGIRKK